MPTKYIDNAEDQSLLKDLSDKIENGYADYNDYKQYEDILKKYPSAYSRVIEELKKKGATSILELYQRKQKEKLLQEQWKTAGAIGALLGVVLGLIILSNREK